MQNVYGGSVFVISREMFLKCKAFVLLKFSLRKIHWYVGGKHWNSGFRLDLKNVWT